ncbi:MAG TPA: hypothetical protein DHU75_09430 [Rikenellaceae bacterium]|nr:hypothetical protein [Rikenellaceae bacterium]
MKCGLRFITVICSLWVISCTKVEEIEPALGQGVCYDVISSKAVVAFPKDFSFFSTAYHLRSGNWDANKSSANIYRDGWDRLQNQEVSFRESLWCTATEFHWPSTGTLTFFSYRQPLVTPSITVDGISFSGWDVSKYRARSFDDQTILVADIAKDKKKNETLGSFSGVPTHFKHKLAKLTFKAAISPYADDDPTITISRVYLKDIYLKGDYKRGGYDNDAWSNLSSLSGTGYDVCSTSTTLTTTAEILGASMVMIPQMLSDSASLVIEYTSTINGVSEDKSATLLFVNHFRTSEWNMGFSYTYTIYVGVGQYPIDFTGSVDNWTNASGADVNVGE